jgi:hypothetical protein
LAADAGFDTENLLVARWPDEPLKGILPIGSP